MLPEVGLLATAITACPGQMRKVSPRAASLSLITACDEALQRFHCICVSVARETRVRLDSGAMAGGGHDAHNVTYGGLTLHPTKGWHSRVGKGMCAIMWFWVLYRAKQDGPVVMGWRHPWEAHGHGGHDDHGSGHEEAKHH